MCCPAPVSLANVKRTYWDHTFQKGASSWSSTAGITSGHTLTPSDGKQVKLTPW